MKNILFILSFLAILSCKAQSPIISTVDWTNDDNGDIELVDGCYLKDIENKFTPFIGIWKWENGNSVLEIEFYKLEMVFDGEIYEDYLVGKYRYVDSSGAQLINSLDYDINTTNMHRRLHDIIYGSGYVTDTSMQFSIRDIANNNLYCYLDFTLTTPTEAIWKIWRTDGGSQPSGFTFPTEVTLTKQ
jgi:hypothetical protein